MSRERVKRLQPQWGTGPGRHKRGSEQVVLALRRGSEEGAARFEGGTALPQSQVRPAPSIRNSSSHTSLQQRLQTKHINVRCTPDLHAAHRFGQRLAGQGGCCDAQRGEGAHKGHLRWLQPHGLDEEEGKEPERHACRAGEQGCVQGATKWGKTCTDS